MREVLQKLDGTSWRIDHLRLARPCRELGRTAQTARELEIITDNRIAMGILSGSLTLGEINTLNTLMHAHRAPRTAGELVEIEIWQNLYEGDMVRARQEFGRAKNTLNAFSKLVVKLDMIEQSDEGKGSIPTYWLNPEIAIIDRRNWVVALDSI